MHVFKMFFYKTEKNMFFMFYICKLMFLTYMPGHITWRILVRLLQTLSLQAKTCKMANKVLGMTRSGRGMHSKPLPLSTGVIVVCNAIIRSDRQYTYYISCCIPEKFVLKSPSCTISGRNFVPPTFWTVSK